MHASALLLLQPKPAATALGGKRSNRKKGDTGLQATTELPLPAIAFLN